MAMEDVVVGTELSPQDFVWSEAAQRFELSLGEGMVRNPAGVYSLDMAAIQAMIGSAAGSGGLDTAAVQGIVDAALAARPDASRLTSHGFDDVAKTFTSTLADGTQVVVGTPGIFTTAELAARTVPLVSVSGRPVGNVLVLAP